MISVVGAMGHRRGEQVSVVLIETKLREHRGDACVPDAVGLHAAFRLAAGAARELNGLHVVRSQIVVDGPLAIETLDEAFKRRGIAWRVAGFADNAMPRRHTRSSRRNSHRQK